MSKRKLVEAWAVFKGDLLMCAAQYKEAHILRLGASDERLVHLVEQSPAQAAERAVYRAAVRWAKACESRPRSALKRLQAISSTQAKLRLEISRALSRAKGRKAK